MVWDLEIVVAGKAPFVHFLEAIRTSSASRGPVCQGLTAGPRPSEMGLPVQAVSP